MKESITVGQIQFNVDEMGVHFHAIDNDAAKLEPLINIIVDYLSRDHSPPDLSIAVHHFQMLESAIKSGEYKIILGKLQGSEALVPIICAVTDETATETGIHPVANLCPYWDVNKFYAPVDEDISIRNVE